MKTLVSYEPSPLDHSLAQKLWSQLPKGRRIGADAEAHIVLYDQVHEAMRGFTNDPTVLRIVVATSVPQDLPKGVFWIKPDIGTFLNLIRALNPVF
jgi:hypothetical protein